MFYNHKSYFKKVFEKKKLKISNMKFDKFAIKICKNLDQEEDLRG